MTIAITAFAASLLYLAAALLLAIKEAHAPRRRPPGVLHYLLVPAGLVLLAIVLLGRAWRQRGRRKAAR